MGVGGTGVLASRVSTSLGSNITLSTALSSTTTRSSVGLSVGFALFSAIKHFSKEKHGKGLAIFFRPATFKIT